VKSFTREQLDSLLEVAKKHNERDWLMLLCTFNHGLRVSETLSLTKDNIANGYLIVERGKGSHRCEHPLLPSESEALDTLAVTGDGRLFPISRVTFWRRMQKYGKEAGLPEFLCHPHSLKHSCGRLGFKGGMTVPDLVEWLGHKNPANSLIYAKSDIATAFAAFTTAISPATKSTAAGGK
jgi:integrase